MPKLGSEETSRRLGNLRRYQALNLDGKIQYSHRLIDAGLEISRRPFVAWSSGKDSQVLLHLILQFEPEIDVIFNNTGVEYKETLRHVKRMEEEWNLNLHVARPEKGKDFWWCLEEFGYPLLGKNFTKQTNFSHSKKQEKVMNSGARISPSCCYYCKEKPAHKLCKQLGYDLLFLGIIAEESRPRTFAWINHGDFRWNKKEKVWKIHPLSIWTEADVWEYHHRYDIPACELYAMGHRRNGCWPCGMDIAHKGNHLSTLRKTHPRLWKFLIIDKGLGKELLKIKWALSNGQYDMFVANRSIEELVETLPCVFDRL